MRKIKIKTSKGKGDGLKKRARRKRDTDKFVNPYNLQRKNGRHKTIHLAYKTDV